MRLLQWMGAAAFLCLAMLGCEDDPRLSGDGESCVVSADCAGGLFCVQNSCVMEGASPARAAGAGETCKTTSDCAMDFLCVSGGCAESATPALGGRGETCRARNECRDGLACVGARCLDQDTTVVATQKQCDIIQCAENADCCAPLTLGCSQLQDDCADGDTAACTNFEANCECSMRCANEMCLFERKCDDDFDCFGTGASCTGGVCVNCVKNSDCAGDFVCDQGACTLECTDNSQCGAMRDCKKGKCEDRTCRSDAECVTLTGNARAVCNDKFNQCSLPCEADSECAGQWGSDGTSAIGGEGTVCNDNLCVVVGCDSDEDCRSRNGGGDNIGGTPLLHVCR